MQDSLRRTACFILFFSLISCASAAYGGGSIIRNGGDTVYCAQSDLNSISGHYTLDYLLEYRSPSDGELAAITSWDESRVRIGALLQKLYPALSSHFNEFTNYVENTSDLQAPRVWVSRALGLEVINDQNITRNLPPNCLDLRNGSSAPQITQTVIRTLNHPWIQYDFDPGVLTMQKAKNPLQYSFFMVHEWLWDITDQVDTIRKINWLLHSKKVETMSPDEFQRIFKSFGLFDRKLGPCDKSEALKKGLSRLFPGASCDAITDDQLKAVGNLDLSNLSVRYPFRVGDFYEFSAVETLNLSLNPNLLNYLYPEFFSSLYSLKTLNLASSGIQNLGADFLSSLTYIEELDLSQNPLVVVDPSFQLMTHLKKLRMSVLNPALFEGVSQLENLPPSLEALELEFSSTENSRRTDLLNLLHQVRPSLKVTTF